MTTFDELFRYVLLPALGAWAFVALVWSIREYVRDLREDGW